MAKALKKGLPARSNRGYRFVLTPLADAMFQLLIFFMLSSNLAPYSLQLIRSGSAGEEAGGGGNQVSEAQTPPAGAAIWTVDAEEIIAGGQRFSRADLPALAEALSASGEPSVILVLRDAALVQDLSSVLEALTVAGVESVQIASGGET